MKKTPTVAILLFWLLSSSGAEDDQTSESLPAPNIFLIPNWRITLRGNATIVCNVSVSSRLNFHLEKDAQIITTSTEGINGTAYFPITNMSPEQGGVYKCCYNSSSLSPATCSEPLELLITDPGLPRSTIRLIPRKIIHKGINVSFQCSAASPVRGFYLHKDGRKWKDLPVEPHKENATFSISNVNHGYGGTYSCTSYTSSSYLLISESSNVVDLFVVDSKFPRPAISPSPIMLVPPGGNATIQCKSNKPSMRFFYLQKSGDEMPQQSLETNETVAEFHIMNANKNHTGEYSCRYSTESAPFIVSKMSNLTRLVITDSHLPKPSISLIPDGIVMLTDRMRIECTANHSGNRFYLYKGIDKKQQQIVITEGNRVLFPINNLHKEDAGSFSCSYMNPSEFFTTSETSDNVTLLVTDPSLPKPNISSENMKFIVLESNISVNCGESALNGNYFLLKDDHVISHHSLEANETTFVISNATLAHGGKYACSYSSSSQPFVISLQSKNVTIQITDPTLMKPSISLSPSGMTRLKSNISILCRVQNLNNTFHLNSTFYLYKIYTIKNTGDEDHKPQIMQPDNLTAEFFISILKKEQGGKYHCSYKPPSGSLMSEPSDSLEIFLLDPQLEQPTISKRGNTMIGENVTISCTISSTNMKFYLHKNGNPTPGLEMETDFDMGTFFIPNISLEHSGNYSCSYTAVGNRFVYSPPSEILQLLVSEKPDYTVANIIHCVIGALILLLLGCLMTLDCHSTKAYEVSPQQRSKQESLGETSLSPALDADPDPAPPTNQE
nr:leukocyte immunoglobulin-like receptor subfamily A member 2 [Anolis sagrei ordinatus]